MTSDQTTLLADLTSQLRRNIITLGAAAEQLDDLGSHNLAALLRLKIKENWAVVDRAQAAVKAECAEAYHSS